jgi:uncharacterized protein YndB with AHSA1/START domain
MSATVAPGHARFTIERRFRASPAKVFAAFRDPAAKRRWFAEGEGFATHQFDMDFRVGGRDFARFSFGDMPEMFNETFYLDIVEDRRLVFAYAMGTAAGRFSASLATITLEADGDGTQMRFTEQATFFEGADGIAMREAGTRELLEALARELGE